jgi:hypothetical protein
MRTSARLTTTAVAIAVLAITTACSRASSAPPADGTGESSASSTTSETAPASIPPTVSRPLTDFIEDEYYYSFATPSGQIQCRFGDHALACQVDGASTSFTVADSALCGFYPGVEQGRTSRFGFFKDQPQPCATIVQGVGFHSPHTLAYGQAVTAELSPGRTVTRVSAVDGLTCTSADGIGSRGFHLTVDSFTVI